MFHTTSTKTLNICFGISFSFQHVVVYYDPEIMSISLEMDVSNLHTKLSLAFYYQSQKSVYLVRWRWTNLDRDEWSEHNTVHLWHIFDGEQCCVSLLDRSRPCRSSRSGRIELGMVLERILLVRSMLKWCCRNIELPAGMLRNTEEWWYACCVVLTGICCRNECMC